MWPVKEGTALKGRTISGEFSMASLSWIVFALILLVKHDHKRGIRTFKRLNYSQDSQNSLLQDARRRSSYRSSRSTFCKSTQSLIQDEQFIRKSIPFWNRTHILINLLGLTFFILILDSFVVVFFLFGGLKNWTLRIVTKHLLYKNIWEGKQNFQF